MVVFPHVVDQLSKHDIWSLLSFSWVDDATFCHRVHYDIVLGSVSGPFPLFHWCVCLLVLALPNIIQGWRVLGVGEREASLCLQFKLILYSSPEARAQDKH